MEPAKTINYISTFDISPLIRLEVNLPGQEVEPLTLETYEELVGSNREYKIAVIQDRDSTHLYCLDYATFCAYGGSNVPNPLTKGKITNVFCLQYAGNNSFTLNEPLKKRKGSFIKIDLAKFFTPLKVSASINISAIEKKSPSFPEIIALTFHQENPRCFDASLLEKNVDLQKIEGLFFFKLNSLKTEYACFFNKKRESEKFITMFYQALNGNKEAPLFLGNCYMNGKEACEKNEEMAFFWYQCAAERGNIQAEMHLGELYLKNKKLLKAITCFEVVVNKDTKNGHAKIKLALALIENEQYKKAFHLVENLKETREVEFIKGIYYYYETKEQSKILHHLQSAANKDFLNAKTYLGFYYISLAQYEKGLPLLIEGANKNYPPALFCLYACYRDGTGVPKDGKKAAEYVQKAAELGHVKAAVCWSSLLFEGLEVEKNDEEALKWAKKAEENGDSSAHVMLASIYGSQKDETNAYKYLQSSAKLKNKEAAYLLFQLHQDKKNMKEAIKALQLAFDLGHKEACFELGSYYENLNTPAGAQMALKCWQKGVDRNDAMSAQALANCYKTGYLLKQDLYRGVVYETIAEELAKNNQKLKIIT